jgi:hypothetical protein
MADDRLKKHLHRQIEFICDTEEGTVHDVVVRMATDSKEDDALVSSVAQTVRRRALLISARDVLPVSRDVLEASRPKRGARASSKQQQQLRGEPHSLLAQVAASAPPGSREVALDEIREESRRALAPLLEAGVVREATTALAAMPARRRPPPLDAVGFWTSGSAVLQIREEDMHNLIESVPGIEDMMLNRRLHVPPVAVPKQLPQPVEDSKAGTWGIRKIGALSAWGAYGKRGEGSLVGLLDTGVDASHPDLLGKIAQWAEFDAKGKKVKNSKPHDSHQHGTHCAGTIAGGNASGRWIGVAPGAKIAAALVLNGEQGGTDAQVLAGIDWAVETKVDVISMSLGGFVLGPDTPSTYTKAMVSALRLGIPIVAAIGNEGSQTSGSPGNDLLAFAIGATDPNDRAAGFSGGRTQIIQESSFFSDDILPLIYSKPDVSAPGVAVFSSIPQGAWEHFNGTSMATPHVAGAIALLLSATNVKTVAPAERAFLIQDLLTGSAEELGESGQNHRFGFGRIDVLRAIGFAHEKGFGP